MGPARVREPGIYGGSSLSGFCGRGNFDFVSSWGEPRGAEGLPIQHEAVGVVSQAIQRGRRQKPVSWKSLVPLGEVEVAGDDGAGGFVALSNQVMQVFIRRRAQGLEPEVIDDEELPRERLASLRS